MLKKLSFLLLLFPLPAFADDFSNALTFILKGDEKQLSYKNIEANFMLSSNFKTMNAEIEIILKNHADTFDEVIFDNCIANMKIKSEGYQIKKRACQSSMDAYGNCVGDNYGQKEETGKYEENFQLNLNNVNWNASTINNKELRLTCNDTCINYSALTSPSNSIIEHEYKGNGIVIMLPARIERIRKAVDLLIKACPGKPSQF